ncbi:MAG: sulfatase [Saprospiraceae bacterium]|nr:sulfatase [Saprospiraceae bacterium]
MLRKNASLFFSLGIFVFLFSCGQRDQQLHTESKKPNILFAISDDQSYPYTSAYGSKTVSTPYFDAIAKKGMLFNRVFCAAPQCSPNRAAILTGKNIWQLEEAGTHASYFPKKFSVFTDQLEQGGYTLGYTGKAWGPGNWKDSGWSRNPVGPEYNEIKFDSVPTTGISKTDYAGNFKAFLDQRDSQKPFFFWYGAFEPHRVYEEGSGQLSGKTLASADVPPFLPDVPAVRNDILDYAREIEWFDTQLGKMLQMLENLGELDNTIVIITADNGMAFPYAKANLQEFGIHVPLAICGPGIQADITSSDLISHTDLAPTILELAGAQPLHNVSGRSFLGLLQGDHTYEPRMWIVAGRERHTHARPDNLGYPARAIRTQDFLYIQNLKPDRWPAGDPEIELLEKDEDGKEKIVMAPGYFDIDASPSKEFVRTHQIEFPQEFNLGFAKRPQEQLFDIKSDPGCLVNIEGQQQYKEIENDLRIQLEKILTAEKDPRMEGSEIFDSYPRVSPMRNFPGFKEQSTYNPAFQKNVQKN